MRATIKISAQSCEVTAARRAQSVAPIEAVRRPQQPPMTKATTSWQVGEKTPLTEEGTERKSNTNKEIT